VEIYKETIHYDRDKMVSSMQERLERAEANVERMTRAMSAAAHTSSTVAGPSGGTGDTNVGGADENLDGTAIGLETIDEEREGNINTINLRSDTEDDSYVPTVQKGKNKEGRSSVEEDSTREAEVLSKHTYLS
jgi:hypothetical protein